MVRAPRRIWIARDNLPTVSIRYVAGSTRTPRERTDSSQGNNRERDNRARDKSRDEDKVRGSEVKSRDSKASKGSKVKRDSRVDRRVVNNQASNKAKGNRPAGRRMEANR